MRKVLIILVLANLILVVYLGVRRIGVTAEQSTTPQSLRSISKTELQDDTGKRISISSLVGQVTAVWFVNPDVSNQVDGISRTIYAYEPNEVTFILITPDSHALRIQLPSLDNNVSIVQHDYAALKKIFAVPECCERRLIFDTAGVLQYHDYYVESDLRPRLNLLAKKRLPELPFALVDSLKSLTTGHIGLVREKTRHTQSRQAAIVLFSSVSTNCPSGELVKLLNQYSERRKDVTFLLLLPRHYTGIDIKNFKTNLQLSNNFDVETMDDLLAERWASLTHNYGENRINGTVILMNRGELSVALGISEVQQKLSEL